MPPSLPKAIRALLACLLLAGCHGYITSDAPLLTVANASYPFPASADIEAMTLDDNHVWQPITGKARLSLLQRNYRVTDPDERTPTPETYLLQRVSGDAFIVQATRVQTGATERAYALIVHADRYYLFAFNSGDHTCANLSDAERARFHAVLRDDACFVSDRRDLTALLLFLRDRFPLPTSAFVVR